MNLDTSTAGSSFSSAAHEALAEKPMVSLDSVDVVTTRPKFTAMEFETKSKSCANFSPACCAWNGWRYTCFDRMYSSAQYCYMWIYPDTLSANTDLDLDAMKRLCANNDIDGKKTVLCCCSGVSYCQYRIPLNITDGV